MSRITNIKLRRGTDSDWENVNPVLDAGEPGFDTTHKILKIGDGTTPWSQLIGISGSTTLANSNYGTNRGVISVESTTSTFNVAGGYVVGALDVFINGVKLVSGIDYTAYNGTSFTIAQPVPAGNVVEYIALALMNADGLATDQYSASISRDIINVVGNNLTTLSITGGYDLGGVDIYQNGVKLTRGVDFTATDGSTINFTVPPPDGSVIEYVSFHAGKPRRNVTTVSTSITAGIAYQTDYVYVAMNPLTITMPTAVDNSNRYTIKNLSTGSINVVPAVGQTIDNQSSVIIASQYTSIDLVSNNQNWIII